MSPFFSPDGQSLAFFASGKLKTIPVSGGAAKTLCDAPNGRGGDWGSDGTIFFSPDRKTGLSRVSDRGGSPLVATTLDTGEMTQRFPQVLPGAKALLYTSLSTEGDDFDFDKGNLVVQALPTGVPKVLQRGAYFGRYVPSGHLLFLHNGTLFAEGFDLAHLKVTNSPVPVIENVATSTTLGAGLFAVSNTGTLAYIPADSFVASLKPIESVDRSGKVASLWSAPSNWADLAFAPDGRRIAFGIDDGKHLDIWVADWARRELTRLTTSNSHSIHPVWTPNGQRIAFTSQRGEREVATTFNLYWQRADGSGDVQRLTTSDNMQAPGSWHPNGKILAFEEQTQSHFNVMLLAMEGDEASGWKPGKPTTLLNANFDQRAPAFSPDGRWLAYESSQSEQLNVYVRAFPGLGGQVPISTGGGALPTWSRTRNELLYSRLDGQIMVVNYSVSGGSFKAETPRPWPGARYNARALLGTRFREFDLHPDGNRLAMAPVGAAGPPARRYEVDIFLNFFDVLRRIAPSQHD
jgi:serine/threonine-protein kinase